MAFPSGWGAKGIRLATEGQNLRFYQEGNTTNAFSGNAFAFIDGANYTPLVASTPGSESPVIRGSSVKGGVPIGGGETNPASPSRFLASGEPQKTAPTAWSRVIKVSNLGAVDLQVSFDGVNIHDIIAAGTSETYRERHEGGISVRHVGGVATAFRIKAW